MGQKCHHTTENWGNKDFLQQDGPVFGNSPNNYFGRGYYFWDNNYRQAKWWGNKQYNGNYYIFEADLEIDKNQMFDTTDRNDLDFLKACFSTFLGQQIDLSDFFLGSVIATLLEEEARSGLTLFPYLYAKGVDNNANTRNNTFPGQIMHFNSKTNSSIHLNPTVIFCIFKKQNVSLNRFTLIEEKGISLKTDG